MVELDAHPRLTNLGTCEFSAALSLPRIPPPALDALEDVGAVKAAKPLVERLARILAKTDVSYLCVLSRARLPRRPLPPPRPRALQLLSVSNSPSSRAGRARCSSPRSPPRGPASAPPSPPRPKTSSSSPVRARATSRPLPYLLPAYPPLSRARARSDRISPRPRGSAPGTLNLTQLCRRRSPRDPSSSAADRPSLKANPPRASSASNKPPSGANAASIVPALPAPSKDAGGRRRGAADEKAPPRRRAAAASRARAAAVEVARGPSDKDLLERFAATLEDVFERAADDAANDGGERSAANDGSARGGASGASTLRPAMPRAELDDVGRQAEALAERGLIGSVPAEDLSRLLDCLAATVDASRGIDLGPEDDPRGPAVRAVLAGLDAANASLAILGAEDAPREVYREEGIDKIVDAVKQHATRNVFAFYDASYAQIRAGTGARSGPPRRGGASDEEEEEEEEERARGDASGGKTRGGRSPATPKPRGRPKKRGGSAAVSADPSRGTVARLRGPPPKFAASIRDAIAESATRLAALLRAVRLPDATLLQLTTLGVSSLAVEGADLIQTEAVELVAAAFKRYPEHRSIVLDAMLVTLLKLPTTGRGVRRYMLPRDEAGAATQATTAMLMRCLHACVSFDARDEDEDEDAEANDPERRRTAMVVAEGDAADERCRARDRRVSRGFDPAFRWASYFWRELLTGWASARAQEIDVKALMQNLVSDLLATLNMPEWPSSGLALLSLCQELLSSRGVKSPEIRVRELSLDFLGQIAARAAADALACERDRLWRDAFGAERNDADEAEDPGATTIDDGDEDEEEDPDAASVLAALETARADAAEARAEAEDRAGGEGARLPVAVPGDVDALVLEAMLLRHVRVTETCAAETSASAASARRSRARRRRAAREFGGALPDAAAAGSSGAPPSFDAAGSLAADEDPDALTFHLAALTREASRRGVGFRADASAGAGGDARAYAHLRAVLARDETEAAGGDAFALGALPRRAAVRLCRALRVRQPLARQRRTLVDRLLGAMEDPAITVRAAATRALANVVDADPRALSEPRVRAAVEGRTRDPGTMVRSAAMDLVGKHVARDADVAEHYYDVVVERVADVGVSVRKRVINALHDLLRQRTFEFRRPIQALRHLAFRVMDDDPGVRDLVVRIFRELWFSKPPAGQKGDPGGVLDRRAAQLVDVLWAVFSGVSRANVARLPLLPTFPIVAILRRIAFPSEEDLAAAKGPAGGDGGAGELEHAAAFARKMCRAVLDGMLRCEEQEEVLEGGEGADGKDGAAAMDRDGKGSDLEELRYPRSARFALGLHAFCAVDPTLCVSDADPLLFATALQPYVKRREDTPANALRLQCCISVVDAAVSETGALAPSTATDIERDLRFLLLRGMHRGVLAYAARCICSVAETTRGDLKRADVASGALQITRRFAKLLEELSEKETLRSGERAHARRALFALGHLARHGADHLEDSREERVSPKHLFELFRSFMKRSAAGSSAEGEFDLKRGALSACGALFVSRPKLMLSPAGGFGKGSMDRVMRAALSPDSERGLKEQALANLDEYLREEERRTLVAMSDDADANAGATQVVGTGGAMSRERRRRRAEAARARSKGGGAYSSDANANANANAGEPGERAPPDAAHHFQTVNGEHDNSLANGVAQRYWSHCLELCADPEPSVRLKALHLAEVVLRQGLVHPMSCFPPLFALQADPVATVRKCAMRLLRQQHGKYADFFDHQLGAGLEALFAFCKRLAVAARRAAKENRRANFADETGKKTGGDGARVHLVNATAQPEDVSRGFSNIYKLVNGTRASRHKFLAALLRRFEGKRGGAGPGPSPDASSSSDATYLCFLANAVSTLPFTMSDEVLFVVFHLNRLVSLRAATLLDGIDARLEKETSGEETKSPREKEDGGEEGADASGRRPAGKRRRVSSAGSPSSRRERSPGRQNASNASKADAPSASLRADVELSLGVSVMLALKKHLKLTYDLTDQRCRSYAPSEPLKTGEGFRRDPSAGVLDLAWVDPLSGTTLEGCASQRAIFDALLEEDANDYAEDALANAKSGGRRKRARETVTSPGGRTVVRGPREDDGSDSEDEDSATLSSDSDESDDDGASPFVAPRTVTIKRTPTSEKKTRRRSGGRAGAAAGAKSPKAAAKSPARKRLRL